MKKIFLLFAAVCAYIACDPVHEDINNGGHITADQLKAMSTVTVDKVVQIAEQKTYTATKDTPIVLMENIDVNDCESLVLYFGEAIADTCWEVSLTGEENSFERIPKKVSVYRCDFGSKVTNGVVPKIVLKHIKDTESNTITVKGIYKNYGYKVAPGKEGMFGNVITCQTSAPVNAKWDFAGKEMIGNYASKKMTVKTDGNGDCVTSEYTVTLTGLCPDGTVVKAEFPVQCDQISNPLVKYYIYGNLDDFPEQKPFTPGNWTGATCRFSSTEAQHFPTISDDIYFGLKTLILDVSNADNCHILVNNGWWSTTYYDDITIVSGANEIPITDQIAKECAKGGEGRDLQFIFKSGGECTINSVYYEE